MNSFHSGNLARISTITYLGNRAGVYASTATPGLIYADLLTEDIGAPRESLVSEAVLRPVTYSHYDARLSLAVYSVR